jgi:hypothetical protein
MHDEEDIPEYLLDDNTSGVLSQSAGLWDDFANDNLL